MRNSKDALEKEVFDYADIFADIINVLLFDGEPVIDPRSVVNAKTRSIIKANDGDINEQERDVLKGIVIDGVWIAVIGIENQSYPDPFMPMRNMSYDGASYKDEINHIRATERENTIRRKNGEEPLLVPDIYPVITVVLYFGMERWNYGKTLKESIDIPENFKPYVNDYRLNLFEIAFLPDETIEKFQSDFKVVAQFFSDMRKIYSGEIKREDLTTKELDIIHVEEVVELLVKITGDKSIRDAYIKAALKGGKVMSTMFTQVFRHEIAETEARVRAEVQAENQVVIDALQTRIENLEKQLAEKSPK